jgi:hypothetical protein
MFQFDQIDKNIQQTLFNRIDALNRDKSYSPLQPRNVDSSNAMDEMLTKSVWARVTSAVYDYDEDGKVDEKKLFRLSSAFEGGEEVAKTPMNKPLTSKESLRTSKANSVFRPHSGITSISTTFKNHSIQNVTINWKFWDIRDFDKYKNSLLTHGRLVLVEFGWGKNNGISHSGTPDPDKKAPPVTDANDMVQIFRATNERIKLAGGDYYCAIGKIKSFSYKINDQGGFDCTTELTSMGSTLFKGQIDPAPEEAVNEITVENNSKVREEAYNNSNLFFEKFMENFDNNLKEAYKKKEQGVYHDGEKGWCNWAYFEDIVLNTFFAFTTEGENLPQPDGTKDYGNPNTKLMTSVRSMGITFNMDKKGNKEPEVITGPTTCRSGKNLFTISKHIILPGKTAGIIPTQGKEGLKNSGIGALMNKKFEGSETLKDYTDFFHTLQAIKDDPERIPKFELTAEEMKTVNDPDTDKDESLTPSVEGKGIIRNFLFSSEFLKSQFSGGVRDLESALNSFWSTVNAQYGSYWDFKVVNQTNNTGQIGVVDLYSTRYRVGDVNPELDMTHTESKARDCNRTFVFRNFGKDSLLKSFDMDVKLSSAQATMAMFHTNKNTKKKGDSGTQKPEDFGLRALAELQNTDLSGAGGDDKDKHKDVVLKNITYPSAEGKIAKRSINTKQDSAVEFKPASDSFTQPMGDKSPNEIIKELESNRLTEEEIDKFDEAYNWFNVDTPQNVGLIWNPDGTMIPSYEKTMIYLLTMSPEAQYEIDPLVPLGVTFTMAGIGGIDLYDMFAVDYLPEVYRKYALFQVSSQDHQLDASGWTTSITGQMRIDMKGLKKDTGKLIEEETKEVIGDGTESISFVDFHVKARENQTPQE